MFRLLIINISLRANPKLKVMRKEHPLSSTKFPSLSSSTKETFSRFYRKLQRWDANYKEGCVTFGYCVCGFVFQLWWMCCEKILYKKEYTDFHSNFLILSVRVWWPSAEEPQENNSRNYWELQGHQVAREEGIAWPSIMEEAHQGNSLWLNYLASQIWPQSICVLISLSPALFINFNHCQKGYHA